MQQRCCWLKYLWETQLSHAENHSSWCCPPSQSDIQHVGQCSWVTSEGGHQWHPSYKTLGKQGLSSTDLIQTLSSSRWENGPLLFVIRNEADFTSGCVNQKSLKRIKTSPASQEKSCSLAASGASHTPWIMWDLLKWLHIKSLWMWGWRDKASS